MSIKFYLAIIRQRLPYLLLVIMLFTGAGLVMAVELPDEYETSATLLVEGPQIPDELAASTVQTNAREQLDVLTNRLLTRANLISIARTHNVFPNIDGMSPDQIVAAMRANSTVRTIGRRDQATRMTVGFRSSKPDTAANVANEYVTLILSESARFRSVRAEGTQEFFEQEVDRLNKELEIQKAKIVEFQNANSDALPSALNFNMERRSDLLESLAQAERDKTVLSEQRVRLISIFNNTGRIAPATEAELSPEQRQLRVKTRVEQLQDVVAAQTGVSDESESPQEAVLNSELAQIDRRIALIDELQEEAKQELKRTEAVLDRIPRNGIALESLERDYNNTQQQYNTAVNRLAVAQTGERIELLAKGERITVIESASVPSAPTSPNRPVIAGGGMMAGFGAATALFVLLEVLNSAIRRPKELTTALGITPFAVLPYMQTRAEKRRRWLVKMVVVLLGLALIVGGAWAVHTFYAPLDFVIERVLEKLGVNGLF